MRHTDPKHGLSVPPSEPARIIAGSGRSGTTWLLDALAEANELRPVFEPLHPIAIPAASPFAYRYFRRTSEQSAAREFLDDVFAGELHSWWTDYRVRPDRLRPRAKTFSSVSSMHEYLRRWRKLESQRRRYRPALARKRLIVKFIRANLMLDWISAHYDARIVLILRHPGAVIESRLRLRGEDWEPQVQLARYLEQPELQQDYLHQYNDLLRNRLSDAEAHAAIWCIENQLPLRQLSSGRATIAYYERLLQDEDASWSSVLEALELEERPAGALLARPSQSAGKTRGSNLDSGHISSWHERLDSATRRRIDGLLRSMHVTVYDMDDPMPRMDHGNERLQRPADERTT